MAVFGVKDFQMPDWMLEEDGDEPDEFGVLEVNWQAANAFLACKTQWRRGPDGTPSGLRYEGVEVVLRSQRVKNREDAFMRVQIMESAALQEFAKAASRSRRSRS